MSLTDNTPAPGVLLNIQNLSVAFGSRRILNGLNLQVPRGRTLVILGESGCGKTTLLRAIAGLIPIADGTIELDGRSMATSSPADRPMIYLDQEPLLFEHLNVAENIAFAMRLRKQASEQDVAVATASLLRSIDLTDHAAKRDWQLSGGQKQRVAFARAILGHPQLLLLDEPFCSLDASTRRQMQTLFAGLSRQHHLTSLFVTHDVKEALLVGDTFARMSENQLFLFPDRQAFMNDRVTGVLDEIDFWQRSANELKSSAPGVQASPPPRSPSGNC